MPAFLNQALISQPHIVYIYESGLYCLVIRFILYMEDKMKLNELIRCLGDTIELYYFFKEEISVGLMRIFIALLILVILYFGEND